MKKIFYFIIIIFIPIALHAWTGDFYITCNTNSWPDLDNIPLASGWTFGGSGNNPASGSLSKVLTLTCVSSPSEAGEISSGTFYFRIMHNEDGAWHSWGGSGSDVAVTLNDPDETITHDNNWSVGGSKTFNATVGNTYQILFQSTPNAIGGSNNLCILEFNNASATISGVSDDGPVNAGTDLIVTVTSSLSPPPTDQKFWVRYIYNDGDWSGASFVGNTISSGNSVELTIPGLAEGGNTSYYVFTTESNISPDNSNCDKATLWLNGYTDNSYDQTLPVTLTTFTAQYVNNQAQLYWRTQTETDNIGWNVYRANSDDYSTSEQINGSLIDGYGTTTEPHDYTFADNTLQPQAGSYYYYWIENIDLSGQTTINGPTELYIPPTDEPGNNTAPAQEHDGLYDVKNNPFQAGVEATAISFILQQKSAVDLSVFNVKGQLVRKLYNGFATGKNLTWDGKDDAGKLQQAGVYLYRLQVNEKVYDTQKVILVR